MNGIIVPDANSILRLISPTYNTLGDKQQLGTIAVIGGIHGATSAAYLAAISALKLGAGFSYVLCTKVAAPVIQNYSPELLVMPILYESNSVRDEDKVSVSKRLVEAAVKWLIHFDCLIIGPGLGSDQFLQVLSNSQNHVQHCVSEIMKRARQAGIPMVVEGDGYDLISKDINLIRGYPLVVLPIHNNVFKKLVQANMDLNDEDVVQQLLSFSNWLGGVTILLKGRSDYISDGEQVYQINTVGCGRNCCQDEFALSGSIAVFIAWARRQAAKGPLPSSQTLLGCIAASTVFKRAGAFAFDNKKRSTLTTDIIENLARSLEELCPLQTQ